MSDDVYDINMAMPKSGEIYKCLRDGREYKIITLSQNTKDPRRIDVIYEALDSKGNLGKELALRKSLEEFCGYKVFHKSKTYNGKKYDEGDIIKRFTKI